MLSQGSTTTTTPTNPASELVEGITNLDETCGQDPSWACRHVLDATGNDTLAGVADWFVARPLEILAIVVGALVVGRVARWLIKRSLHRRLDPKHRTTRRRLRAVTPAVLQSEEAWSARTEARVHTVTAVLQSVVTVLIWVVAVIWVIDVIGLDLGPLVAGAGIAGVALGFGAQNLVRDFLAGFFMVVEDQLGVGDFVDLEPGVEGTVERVTLRATRLRGLDGTVWHVPNGQILRVGNMSQEWARAVIDVEVAYGTDMAVANDVIMETAEGLRSDPLWSHELLEPPEIWGVQELGPSGVTIRLVVKTKPGAQWGIGRELRGRILAAFPGAGVEIPFPQLTIHRTVEGPATPGGGTDAEPDAADADADGEADPSAPPDDTARS